MTEPIEEVTIDTMNSITDRYDRMRAKRLRAEWLEKVRKEERDEAVRAENKKNNFKNRRKNK